MSHANRLEAVFHDARALSGDARAAYLDRACAGDVALRAQVELLLRSDVAAGSIFDAVPETRLQADIQRVELTDALQERPGTKIGAYKLLEQIGEGGFGVVFMADQEQPFRRRVALKIIKAGMDTRQVVARFEQERQALALMDHANIAKVFDAGSTATGRPYFVMELCRGEAITDYCDKQNLSIPQRLELFAQVCTAVQHAHSKGIIHRDIKPSNVLISTQDGKPQVKIIDFGIAKATSSRLTEKTLFTAFKQMIGTPQYMSPEQAEGSLDIDTRTDVYALGVLLYELLTGVTPFDPKSLRSAAYGEIERIIREVDPPSPSARLSQNTETIASVAASRQSEPRKLGPIVRGELDWIVMKALEKDRQRRYETANGLAMDIGRYLGGEAVLAAPASRSYRIRKFVRRHKGLVTAVSAVAAALLVGVIAFAWQASIARHERDRAILAEADANQRAKELGQVSAFQGQMLRGIDTTDAGVKLMEDIRNRFASAIEEKRLSAPERNQRLDAFTRELNEVNATDTAVAMIERAILKPAISAVDASFREQPAVDASLRHTVASIYQVLGLTRDAIALEKVALATRQRIFGDANVETLESMNDIGLMFEADGQFAEAESMLKGSFEGRKRVLGESDPATLVTMGNLGNFFRGRGRFDEAEPLLRRHVEESRRVLGNDHRDTLIAINCYGFLFVDQGKLTEAEPLWRETYDRGRRVMGQDDPDLIVWVNNLGGLISVQGRVREAEPYFREALEKTRRVRGESHPSTIGMIGILAGNLTRQGRVDEAEPLLREAWEKSRKTLGDANAATIDCHFALGRCYMLQGRYDEAEPMMLAALAATRQLMGPEHPQALVAMSEVATLYRNQNKLHEAEATYREAFEISSRVLGPEHPDTLITMTNLGGVLLVEKRFDLAEPILRKSLETRTRISGPLHPETLIAASNVGRMLEEQGKLAEAENLLRDTLAKFRTALGNDHPNTLLAIANLARVLNAEQKFAEAEPLIREVISGYERKPRVDEQDIAPSRLLLGETLTGLKRFAEAERELLSADRVLSSAPGTSMDRRKRVLRALLVLYRSWDAAEPGKGHDAKAAEWDSMLEGLTPATLPATHQGFISPQLRSMVILQFRKSNFVGLPWPYGARKRWASSNVLPSLWRRNCRPRIPAAWACSIPSIRCGHQSLSLSARQLADGLIELSAASSIFGNDSPRCSSDLAIG